ncbi:type II secretion system F family protein [Immundisolibacter sp.]|uniref:type II secretion system F family protein n=1 Tax=Immundisolibacter sp. TaxID=1934948 RepID=UPI002631D937|nr:type II secretion system F family protein [Immundisolibacter sp.]MDD3650352.1 type II secretion system F family protein [Immundisolibacter sp.]
MAAARPAAPERINTYTWSGFDRNGKRLSGELKSADELFVREQLRKRGVLRARVRRKSALFEARHKVSAADVAYFTRQLATMLEAGVPIVASFDIIGRGHDNPAMTEMLMAIKTQIEGGLSLHEALAQHPRQFNELYVNLVAAGEQAGILDSVLGKLSVYLEKSEALKRKIRSALFYPAAVIAVGFIVTTILLVFVIPQFESLFKGFGADLPALTAWVVELSRGFRKWWWMVILGVAAAVVVAIQAHRRSERFRDFLDAAALRIPLIGDIIRKGAVARFARTLSTMFGAGVPLVEAMDSVARAVGNVVYEKGIRRIRDDVATGSSLHVAMLNTNLFAHMVNQMVAIGEESGSVDHMLSKVADFYEDEVDQMVSRLTSLMEPLIMSVLGVIVGGLVIAMYLPIFKLASVF